MSDEFESELFDAEFAGLPLHVLNTQDSRRRVRVRHRRPHQDGALITDLGREPRETSVTLVFMPPGAIASAEAFLEAADRPEAQLFVHPLWGSMLAWCEDPQPTASAEDRDYLEISCTFVEDHAQESGLGARISAASAADRSRVDAAIATVTPALEALGGSTVPAEITAQLDAWDVAAPSELNARRVNLEVNRLTNDLQVELDRLDLAADVANYPLIVGLGQLHSQLRKLANRYIAEAPTLTTYEVRATRPLMSILQELYGGARAAEKYGQTLELNKLRNPAAVERGTLLVVEAP
jgi:prophage DNA circulation protein